jgi:hypothetical protein
MALIVIAAHAQTAADMLHACATVQSGARIECNSETTQIVSANRVNVFVNRQNAF